MSEGFIILWSLFWLVVWLGITAYVGYDANERGLAWPLWAIAVFLFGLFGVVIYLLRVMLGEDTDRR